MENLVLPCKSTPTPTILPSRKDLEFSSKFIVRFKTAFRKSSPKLDQNISDSHLNYLCKNGKISEAIVVLDSIAQQGFKIKPITYVRLLQKCIDMNALQLGQKLHSRISLVEQVDPFVETKLVSLYAKCGCLEKAFKVFDEMRERNLYTWSAMIGGCSRERRYTDVVSLFVSMMEDGVLPDELLLTKILQACASCEDVEIGELVHSLVIRCAINSSDHVNNSLLAMYAKCGKLDSARRFFDHMNQRDTVSWNSIILGYCEKGDVKEGQLLFDAMRKEGIEPSLVTWNILISSYNQCGNCNAAMELMKKMECSRMTPDVFTWTSMISGFSQNNRIAEAVELFSEMLLAGVEPNAVTITSTIAACASLKALKKGKVLHCFAVKVGSVDNVLIENALIDMYSKCKDLEDARRVFDMTVEKDIYTWNSMIGGYSQAGYCGKAHELFMKMEEMGIQRNVISWNIMISGYIQKGDEDLAMDLFQRMERDGKIKRNTASWNSLIAGFIQNGHKNKALGIFRQMQSLAIRPNSVTVLSVLPACANLVALKKVKEIHGCVLRISLDTELSVSNFLIDSYAKSGEIPYSKTLFDGLPSKDIITWNSLLAGYVLHGLSSAALNLFDQMTKEGFTPNRSTFVSVILAYSLSGMVDQGKQTFTRIDEEYKITPGLEHYLAIVDMFGRSGRLREAVKFIEEMGIEPESSVWAAFLTACRIHGNVGLAIYALEHLLELEPGNLVIRQLALELSTLYQRSEDFSKTKDLEIWIGNKNSTGCSWIEVNNVVHTFVAGDRSKPTSDSMYFWLKGIEKVSGLKSECGLFIEEEEREEVSGIHSEKLAIAFALIGSDQASQTVRIVKNQRMCRYCHTVAKIISITYGCQIFLSDSSCFHHFANGFCSCGDYW